MRVVLPVDDGVEAVFVVGRVLDHALGTVRLDESVAAVYRVTVPLLALTLHVPGVAVVHRVLELVFRMRVVRLFLVGDVVYRWSRVVDGSDVVYRWSCVRYCVTVAAFVILCCTRTYADRRQYDRCKYYLSKHKMKNCIVSLAKIR